MMHRVTHHDASLESMRTTVTLDEDVAAEVERLRRESGLGLSEALNALARVGVHERRSRTRASFAQETEPLGLIGDVSNVGEVLALLDEAP